MSFYDKLHNQFTIPVLRETSASKLEASALALAKSGLKVLELTLMSDEVFAVIKKLSSQSDLLVGAGTVLNEVQAQKAIDHGAKFLVSPGLNHSAFTCASKNNIPFIPGALTPTEIMQAHTFGCELIKIFPVASVGGAPYLKHLSGPFPNLKWMPSGGINLVKVNEYKEAGAFCVGIGGRNFENKN